LHQKKRVNMSIQSLTTVCAGWVRSWSRPWLACVATGLLSACGGGGGGPSAGDPGTSSISGVTAPVYDAVSTQVTGGGLRVKLADGRTDVPVDGSGVINGVVIEIERHPVNQLCKVSVSGSKSTVSCSQTLINDTGISACFKDGVKVECGSGGVAAAAMVSGAPLSAAGVSTGALALQDGAKGRDPESSRLRKLGCGSDGFDFSRIDANGKVIAEPGGCPVPSAADANWVCTRDNVTGLVWLRKPADSAGFRAATPPAAACGLAGWRLPSVDELASLLNSGAVGIAIDRARFPDVTAQIYWTGSASARDTASAYAARFALSDIPSGSVVGGAIHLLDKTERYPALWVSDTTRNEWLRLRIGSVSNRFVPDFVKGVITDHHSGLMWMLCSIGRESTKLTVGPCSGSATDLSWDDALNRTLSANQNAALGYSDWRLPSRAELISLVNYTGERLMIDSDLGIDTQNTGGAGVTYWSSSGAVATDGRTQVGVHTVEFKDGTTGVVPTTDRLRVRLVRSLP
jgi:hypothetical protein